MKELSTLPAMPRVIGFKKNGTGAFLMSDLSIQRKQQEFGKLTLTHNDQ
jgi:hypothetical protein